LLVARHGC